MCEDLDPEVTHDALTEEAGQHRLTEREKELQDERSCEQRGARENKSRVPGGNRDVNDLTGERRPDELKHPVKQQERERFKHERTIGTGVAKQPPHEPAVVGFAERLFVVYEQRLGLGTGGWGPGLGGSDAKHNATANLLSQPRSHGPQP